MKKFNIIILTIAFLIFVSVGGLLIVDGFKNLGKLEINPFEVNVKIIEEVKPSYEYLKSVTVYLIGELPQTIDKDGKVVEKIKWTGTGTVIKVDDYYTYILTNKHIVADGNKEATVYVENGLKQLETKLVEVHSNLDLAVVKVKGTLKNKRTVKGFNVAYPQDELYLVGHHLGRKYVYGEGVFAGYQGVYDIIQIPTLYGNSGTGVCNKDGELIGVVFAINRINFFDVDASHGLVIDGLSVSLFLEKLGL